MASPYVEEAARRAAQSGSLDEAKAFAKRDRAKRRASRAGQLRIPPNVLAALIWATNMAWEAIELRKVSGDPEDEEMMDHHEAELVKARAIIAKATQS